MNHGYQFNETASATMTLNFDCYMQRALQLAASGLGLVSPNPMVGAVIVDHNGTIIGEGWHRKFGEAHAEVNAFNDVAPSCEPLLPQATLFVTLEPCSHYGKTPPCADLIVRKAVKRVVIGSLDPFHKVSGRGVERLRSAGIEVITGVLEHECRELNKTFFFAHTHDRPFVTLKWAQSIDGWMDSASVHPYRFSTPLTSILVHRLRSLNDAIITSTATAHADNPRLDTRLVNAETAPIPVVVGHGFIEKTSHLGMNHRMLHFPTHDIAEVISQLYHRHGITSALVEAGPTLLQAFIDQNLWNEARAEVNPISLGPDGRHKAPRIAGAPNSCLKIDNNLIYTYRNE